MSEAGEQKYTLTLDTGEVHHISRGFTGKATAMYENGEWYEGTYNEGIREGRGIYQYESGNRYEGDWKNNLRHGIGRMKYINFQMVHLRK